MKERKNLKLEIPKKLLKSKTPTKQKEINFEYKMKENKSAKNLMTKPAKRLLSSKSNISVKY